MGLSRINGTACVVSFCSCLVNLQERWGEYVIFLLPKEEDGIILNCLVAARSLAVLPQTCLP